MLLYVHMHSAGELGSGLAWVNRTGLFWYRGEGKEEDTKRASEEESMNKWVENRNCES